MFRTIDDLPEGDYRRASPRFAGENFAKNLQLVDKINEASYQYYTLSDPILLDAEWDALALGMIVITAFANVIYLVVRTRAERWLK